MNDIETMETTLNQNATKTTGLQDQPLRNSVERSMKNYFAQLGGHAVTNLYEMVLAEVEEPLLREVLIYTKGNQSKAAILLGLSRGTLRKKLALYGL